MKQMTPRQIVKELDRYIIGQTNAKKAVAIALRNRWRRQQVEGRLKDEIMPNNIITASINEIALVSPLIRFAVWSITTFGKVASIPTIIINEIPLPIP